MHLFRPRLRLPPLKLLRRCLSLFHLNFLPNPLLSQFFGVIGNAVPSGVAGSSCFVHKPSCFLPIRFNGRRNKTANRKTRQTRAQRAHWRLSWNERLARNARPSTAPLLKVTIHGLPATFANAFGLGLI